MITGDDVGDGDEELVVVEVHQPVDLLFRLRPHFVVRALQSSHDDLFDAIHKCNYDCSAFPVIPAPYTPPKSHTQATLSTPPLLHPLILK